MPRSVLIGPTHVGPPVPMSSSAAPRLIKKYPNRRLYDTSASVYITLAEIKQLVIECEPLKVVDAKSGEDLTRSILLQIILEEEAAGTPMFNEVVLANLIRLYGQTMHGFMGPWLEQQLKWLTDWQAKGASPEAWSQFMPSWPMPNGAGFVPPSLEAMQEQMKKNAEQMMGVFGLKT